jgi:Plasmid replication region DNA-binding N-term
MPETTKETEVTATTGATAFAARTLALQKRVNEVAREMSAQGLLPTVARIRAALGGGSPNDLAPALKNWKEAVLPALGIASRGASGAGGRAEIPASIADVVQELWQRALVAASTELKGGAKARQIIARTEEAQLLREQVKALRDQLQREALAYGELRAQSARHEAIAKSALTRAHDAEVREREVLHELGAAQQRVAELAASADAEQARAQPRGARMPRSRRKQRASASQSQRRSAGATLRGSKRERTRAKQKHSVKVATRRSRIKRRGR